MRHTPLLSTPSLSSWIQAPVLVALALALSTSAMAVGLPEAPPFGLPDSAPPTGLPAAGLPFGLPGSAPPVELPVLPDGPPLNPSNPAAVVESDGDTISIQITPPAFDEPSLGILIAIGDGMPEFDGPNVVAPDGLDAQPLVEGLELEAALAAGGGGEGSTSILSGLSSVAVPEPGTGLLLATGLAALALGRSRKSA